MVTDGHAVVLKSALFVWSALVPGRSEDTQFDRLSEGRPHMCVHIHCSKWSPPCLQALHEKGRANADHTTLLLNCYTKLKDIDQLDRFVAVSHVLAGGGGGGHVNNMRPACD